MTPNENYLFVGFEVFSTLIIIGFTLWLLISSNNFLNKSENYYPPKNCNLPAGTYAVQVGVNIESVLKNCSGLEGAAEDGTCTFVADNIKEAVEICNKNVEFCDRFIYNETDKTVSFVSLQAPLLASELGNISLYTRQNGVTYASSNDLGIYSNNSSGSNGGNSSYFTITSSSGSNGGGGSSSSGSNGGGGSSSSGSNGGGGSYSTTTSSSGSNGGGGSTSSGSNGGGY